MTPPPDLPDSWAYRAEERHPLVEAFLADQVPAELGRVETAIHAGDEMFAYLSALRHGARDRALVDYFRSGWMAATTLAPLVSGVSVPPPALTPHPPSPPLPAAGERGEPRQAVRILDFASGWGRVTRFLKPLLPGAAIWVSDISRGGVAFQRQVLGVEGFVSASRPEDLEVPGTFDVILVSSLFTHLPRGTFGRWLARLWSLLADGGRLVVSTHDLSAMPAEETADEDGFFFLERSEIDTLAKSEYGETWVSEGFMGAAFGGLDPVPASWVRLPKGLWHFHDLYVAGKGEHLPEPLPFDPGPDGFLEAATLEGGERLWLEGWAADRVRPGSAVRVEVTLNGRPAGSLGTTPREDHLTGWTCRIEPSTGAHLSPLDVVLVKAVSDSGRERAIHLSTVEDLLAELRERKLLADLDFTRQHLQRADWYLRGNAGIIAGLEERIAAMEASRFWKLREAWWRVRGWWGG
jgi:hypothetical protein